MTTRRPETDFRQMTFEGECAFLVSSEWVQQKSWLHMPTKLSKAKGSGRGTWLKSKQKALLCAKVDGDTSFLELQIGNKGILALQNPPADIRYSLISPELSKGSKWLLAAAYTLPAGEVHQFCFRFEGASDNENANKQINLLKKLLKGDKEGVEGTQNVIKAPSYDPSTQRDHTPGDLVSDALEEQGHAALQIEDPELRKKSLQTLVLAFLEDKSFQMYVEELQGVYSDILDKVDASCSKQIEDAVE